MAKVIENQIVKIPKEALKRGHERKIKNIINFLLIFVLILPSFGSINSPQVCFAQNQQIQSPETLGEAKEMGENFAGEAKEKLPGILERIWKEEAVPVWSKMWDWTKNWWKGTVWPWVSSIFQEKIKPPLEEEIEKRKPIIKEEFEKEKQEFKKEAPEVGKSLWERFKEIIK